MGEVLQISWLKVPCDLLPVQAGLFLAPGDVVFGIIFSRLEVLVWALINAV